MDSNENNVISLNREVENASLALKQNLAALEEELAHTAHRFGNQAERLVHLTEQTVKSLNPVPKIQKHPLLSFGLAFGFGFYLSAKR